MGKKYIAFIVFLQITCTLTNPPITEKCHFAMDVMFTS